MNCFGEECDCDEDDEKSLTILSIISSSRESFGYGYEKDIPH